MTPTVPPITRILRTLAQILGAIGIVVPSVVALLGQAGIHVDGAALVALVAAAVLVVTTVMNALEASGLIPTVGQRAPANAPLTDGWPIEYGYPVEGAPLFTASEVATLIAGAWADPVVVHRIHQIIIDADQADQ